jgi:DEAD/DEAH box helicase domain-containing protein
MTNPEWLQPNKQIYSKQHGVIHIAAIIDKNLYFKKGNINQIIFDWQQELNNGNLLPIDEVASSKNILYQEIAAILYPTFRTLTVTSSLVLN